MNVKQCPNCDGETLVINTRVRDTGAIARRRICTECHCRFTTYEIDGDAYKRIVDDRIRY